MDKILKDLHKEFLYGLSTKTLLYQYSIPSPERIKSLTEETYRGKFFGYPIFDLENSLIKEREISSASKINQIFTEIDADSQFIKNTLQDQLDRSNRMYLKNKERLAFLSVAINNLATDIQNHLLISNNSDGFSSVFSDTFDTLNKVDLTKTDSFLDLQGSSVSLGLSSDRVNYERFRILPAQANARFAIINRAKLRSSKQLSNSSTDNLFDNNESIWGYSLDYSSTTDTVNAELVVEFYQPYEINKIVLEPVTSNSQISCLCQVSVDGINWQTLDQPLVLFQNVSWINSLTPIKYFKIIFTKKGYDYLKPDGTCTHIISLKNISLYKEAKKSTSEFYSKPFWLSDKSSFNKASLEVCDVIPDPTNIEYYLSFGFVDDEDNVEYQTDSDTNEQVYYPVDPKGRNTGKPLLVSMSNKSFTFFKDVKVLDKRTIYYPFFNGEEGRICSIVKENGIHPLDLDIDPDQGYTFNLLRNTSDLEVVESTISSVKYNVGNLPKYIQSGKFSAPRGWNYDGSHYETYMYVTNKNGVSINIGEKFIEIDGVEKSSHIDIKYGLHKVRVKKEDWRNIDMSLESGVTYSPGYVSNFDSSSQTISDSYGHTFVDPLWPHNLRYMIEGLIYEDSISQDIKSQIGYPSKADVVLGQFFCSEVSEEEFRNVKQKSLYLDKFCIADQTIFTDEWGGEAVEKKAIIVFGSDDSVGFLSDEDSQQLNSSIGITEDKISQNESFMAIGTYNNDSTEINAVMFHAVLSTQVDGITPAIQSYKINVGK